MMEQSNGAIGGLDLGTDQNGDHAASAPMPCPVAGVISGSFIIGDDQQAVILKHLAGQQRTENILQPVVGLLEGAGIAALGQPLIAPVGALDAVAVVEEIGGDKGIVG